MHTCDLKKHNSEITNTKRHWKQRKWELVSSKKYATWVVGGCIGMRHVYDKGKCSTEERGGLEGW